MMIKTMKHIRTNRNIRSFRSCPHAVGLSMIQLERNGIEVENDRLVTRQTRRYWLDMQYYLRDKKFVKELSKKVR